MKSNFYRENHQNLESEASIRRGIFQGDALSPLLFIIAMMPFNHTLSKFTDGLKLSKP